MPAAKLERASRPPHVCQFLVVLLRTDPLVWRRIQVPGKYSFWDLHVAIQDAMGWDVPIERYLSHRSEPVRYRYDFGDDWTHTVDFEEFLPVGRQRYPRCIAGAGACPPEDVGGSHGYAEFLQTIANPRHPERRAMLEWAGGAFDPNAFDPAAVRFDDPKKRWRRAFAEVEDGE